MWNQSSGVTIVDFEQINTGWDWTCADMRFLKNEDVCSFVSVHLWEKRNGRFQLPKSFDKYNRSGEICLFWEHKSINPFFHNSHYLATVLWLPVQPPRTLHMEEYWWWYQVTPCEAEKRWNFAKTSLWKMLQIATFFHN